MLKRILQSILWALILLLPVSYWVFDRETVDLDEARAAAAPVYLLEMSQGNTRYELSSEAYRPLIVLLHGGAMPMWIWDRYVAYLINTGYQVLRYDMYGRGLSDRPAGEYDRDMYVQQLEELLEKMEWDEKFAIAGYSFGGAIAAEYAARNPDMIHSLVLIAPLIDHSGRVPPAAQWPLAGEYFARIAGVPQAIGRARDLLSNLPHGSDRFEQFVHQTEIQGFERSLLAMSRSDALTDYLPTYKKLGENGIRTMLIWGEQDNEISPHQVHTLRQQVPELEFRAIPFAGHAVNLSHTDAVIQMMLPFLTADW
jgi:pimeloyl-ACP methyl ester carboxylesterase